MTRKRARTLFLGAAGGLLLCSLTLVCCQRPTTRVEATAPPKENQPAEPPPAVVARPVQQPPAVQPTPAPTHDPPSAAPPSNINMDQPAESKPPPPFLAVVEEINPARRSTVTAELHPPRKLVVNTTNVKRLRLTRERLPLTHSRSIVLRIDDQGIEWTSKHVAIELERSAAGEWTVVKRRPRKP